MHKQKRTGSNALVYSTDPFFSFAPNEEYVASLPPVAQRLKIALDKKNRSGKIVTLITGFVATIENLEILCKNLKQYCGTGGAAKNGEIIIQGNHTQKVKDFLLNEGYIVK